MLIIYCTALKHTGVYSKNNKYITRYRFLLIDKDHLNIVYLFLIVEHDLYMFLHSYNVVTILIDFLLFSSAYNIPVV